MIFDNFEKFSIFGVVKNLKFFDVGLIDEQKVGI